KEGAFATTEIQGNIGEELLSKFKVFLDYARNRVILEPNATFARPFDDAFSGLAILAEGKDYKTFRIEDVLENSPASAAGIQKDDVIVTIGGRPASALTLTQILDMLERPVPRRLIVRRAEHRLQIVLRPKKLVLVSVSRRGNSFPLRLGEALFTLKTMPSLPKESINSCSPQWLQLREFW